MSEVAARKTVEEILAGVPSPCRLIAKPLEDSGSKPLIPFQAYNGATVLVQIEDEVPVQAGRWYELVVEKLQGDNFPPNAISCLMLSACPGDHFEPKQYSHLLEFIKQDPQFFDAVAPFKKF